SGGNLLARISGQGKNDTESRLTRMTQMSPGEDQMSTIAYSLMLLPVLALPVAAQTQGPVVTGYVRDSAGRPIPGAVVFVGRTDKPVTTNDAGKFRVHDAPTGPQWVAARRIGYSPVRRSVRIEQHEAQEIDFVMT